MFVAELVTIPIFHLKDIRNCDQFRYIECRLKSNKDRIRTCGGAAFLANLVGIGRASLRPR